VIIAVNTRLLLKNRLEGIGWFTYETLKRITKSHPEHEFLFIFDRPFDSEFVFEKNVKPIVLAPQARHPVLYKIWFNWRIPRVLKKHKVDVFLSPDGYLSLRTNVPQIAVMHDLNFEHYPADLPKVHSRYYRKYFPLFSKVATRLATVSQFSRHDISDQYDVDPQKIDVVYNGVGEHFHPIASDEQLTLRNELSGGADYFVFVGSLHPRKNIHRLLKAFDLFKKQAASEVKLVIVGEKFWWNEEIESAYKTMKFQSDVLFTGRLQTVALNKVVASALALVFVPYFEGFGIPILEAFKCETPVITSNITSMPEVAGSAALLVDPFNVEDIATAMSKVANDPDLRQQLVQKGLTRAQDFSWDRTAILLWGSIEKVLGL
jgi:glycosyltransferase involved in cell wall biosynthesis